MDKYTNLVEQLIAGEIKEIHISKEEFLTFRQVIVQHEKFKHIRGEAKQGGDVIYTYLEVPRS